MCFFLNVVGGRHGMSFTVRGRAHPREKLEKKGTFFPTIVAVGGPFDIKLDV